MTQAPAASVAPAPFVPSLVPDDVPPIPVTAASVVVVNAPSRVAVPPAFPTGEEEWPDPAEAQGLDYLKAMADAYEVKYSPKIKAADLVKKIQAAMYPG